MAERVNKDNFQEKALQPGKLTLLEFYSDGCIPCKKMAPVLAQIEESFGDKLYVGKINVAYEQELVGKYNVMSSPTIVFLKDGVQLEKLTGAVKAEVLEKIIHDNL